MLDQSITGFDPYPTSIRCAPRAIPEAAKISPDGIEEGERWQGHLLEPLTALR